MPRPKNFKVKRKTRKAIAAARTGKNWTTEIKAAIGDGVRHGESNKVAFGTRISGEAAAVIRFKAAAKSLPLAQAVEKAFLDWQ